jgi:hypothetical protein
MSSHSHSTSLVGARRLAIVALCAATAALTGCTAGSASNSGETAPGVQQVAPGEGGAQDADSPTDRAVVSTASVSLSSADPATATEQVVTIATDASGRVDSRTDSPATQNSPASGSVTVRIPSDELDDALAEIKAVGDLRHASLSSTDVTDQVTDVEARVTALRASVDRLLALIGRASTTADLIQLESALSERQAELDSLEAQRDVLGDAVEYATVQVEVSSPGAVAGTTPGDFWGGIVVGFTALVGFFSGLLVVVGILVPWLILLALLVGVIWLIYRRRHSTPAAEPLTAPEQSANSGSASAVPPRPALPTENARTIQPDQKPDITG